MTPEPQKEYIITAELLVKLKDAPLQEQADEIAEIVRQRRYTPHQERERVLEEALGLLKDDDFCPHPERPCSADDTPYPCAICIVKHLQQELRSRGGGGG